MWKDQLVDFLSSYSVLDLMILTGKITGSAGLLYVYTSIINKLVNYLVYDILKFTGSNVPLDYAISYSEESEESEEPLQNYEDSDNESQDQEVVTQGSVNEKISEN